MKKYNYIEQLLRDDEKSDLARYFEYDHLTFHHLEILSNLLCRITDSIKKSIWAVDRAYKKEEIKCPTCLSLGKLVSHMNGWNSNTDKIFNCETCYGSGVVIPPLSDYYDLQMGIKGCKYCFEPLDTTEEKDELCRLCKYFEEYFERGCTKEYIFKEVLSY